MKLYETTSAIYADDESVAHRSFTEFASSADAASKSRTRLKKLGHLDIGTVEVEVPTTRTELIAFLNKRLAHESWVPAAVSDKLKD